MREIIIPELEEIAINSPPRKYWTEEEESIIKRYYGRVPGLEIAKYLGRSRHAVEMKAYSMGITHAKS